MLLAFSFIRCLLPAALLAVLTTAHAQPRSVGIGTSTPDASAALDVSSTTQGLLLPRLSLVQRQAMGTGSIAAPVPGLVIYQTDNTPGLYAYDGTGWVRLGADNLGSHTATQPIGFTTNDADKIYFTQANGANGPKLAHSTGWNLNYYAGPNNGLAGTHRFFTGTATGWAERLRIDATGRVRIGTGGSAPRGLLDVAGTGDSYLVNDPNAGSGQSLYLPGYLFLAPYSGTSGTAYVQARVPNSTSSTSIGLTLRTTNAGTPTDAVVITPAGNLNVAGQVGMGYVYQYYDDNLPGNNYGYFSITCPTGTRLLSGGGGHRDYNSAAGDIKLNYSGPAPSNPERTWRIIIDNTSGSSRAIRVYCTCARVQ